MPRDLIKGLLLLFTLILAGYAASQLQLDLPAWSRRLEQEGWHGPLLFLLLGGLATGLGLPRQIAAFLAGHVYGIALGTLYATLATLLGCMLGFCYARWIGQDFARRRFPRRIAELDRFLRGKTFSMALVIRLLPVGHNAATNFLAGVCGVRVLPFLAGSGIGFLPQNLVFALAGAGMELAAATRISLAAALFLISGGLGLALYRRHQREIQAAGMEKSGESG